MSLPELAIATSWNAGRHHDGLALLTELAELGFQTVELRCSTHSHFWPGIQQAVAQKIVRIASLQHVSPQAHAQPQTAPNDCGFTDPRRQQRAQAVQEVKASIDQAVVCGARVVVLNIGTLPQRHRQAALLQLLRRGQLGSRAYVRQKIAAVREHEQLFATLWPQLQDCLAAANEYAVTNQIRLAFASSPTIEAIPLENQWPLLLDTFPQAGYWHDFAHCAQKDLLGFLDHEAEWHKRLPRLAGCYLHDFPAPDQHQRLPGDGPIPLPKMLPTLPPEALCVFTPSPRLGQEKIRAALTWWQQQPY